jgi:hypothetical protein
MGWVTMSERDLQRIEVLTDVLAGRRTVAAAATVLAVSERQMRNQHSLGNSERTYSDSLEKAQSHRQIISKIPACRKCQE